MEDLCISDWRISEWVDVKILKILSRHASGVIGAIAVFGAVGFAVELLVKESTLKTVVKIIDSFVLVGLVVWLAYQLARLLWTRRV